MLWHHETRARQDNTDARKRRRQQQWRATKRKQGALSRSRKFISRVTGRRAQRCRRLNVYAGFDVALLVPANTSTVAACRSAAMVASVDSPVESWFLERPRNVMSEHSCKHIHRTVSLTDRQETSCCADQTGKPRQSASHETGCPSASSAPFAPRWTRQRLAALRAYKDTG